MNIIESKLTIPDFTPYLVRTRLFSFLEKNLERTLLVVSADGGYGKTTLLSSFVTMNEIPTVWYQMGHADRHPHVFLTYLKTGLHRVMNKMCGASLVRPECLEEELEQLLAILSTWPTRLVIVFDDYQWVNQSQEIREIVTKLLNQSSKSVTYVINSRIRPNLPLVKLKLQQNLAELRTGDLAFTTEETTAFFNTLHHLTLYRHEIDYVVKRTEGWIASLQLICDLISQMNESERRCFWANFTGIPDVYEYLGSEVLASQSEEIQEFLRKTSVLADLHPEVINQYLGIDHAKSVLDHLQAHHLFIFRTNEGVFKYHQLFRMFLLENLNKQYDVHELFTFHREIARIYEARYQFFNAFAHYVAGKDYMSGADVMRRMADRYHADRYLVLIDGWLETISPELSLASTSLFLFRCIPLSVMDTLTGPLEATIEAMKQQKNPLTIAHFQHRLATIQFYRGELAQSKAHYLDSLEGCMASNDYAMIALNLSMLAQVYRFQQKYDEAIHTLKRSLSYSETHGIVHAQMHSLWVLAEVYLEQNELAKAEPLIYQTIELSEQCDAAAKVFPYSSLVKLHRLRGEYEAAFAWADKAVEHASKFHIEPDLGWVYMELGLTFMASGQREKAKASLNKSNEKLARQLRYYLHDEIAKQDEAVEKQQAIAVRQTLEQQLTIRTLGAFELRSGNQPITLNRKTSLRLLQFFIVNRGKKLVKDAILDQVFPAGSFQSVTNQFYVALSALRKALEPALESGRHSRFFVQSGEHYTFCPEGMQLDVDCFLQTLADRSDCLQSERIKRLLQAEQLYRGDFFEEYPYESFLEAEREKLRQFYLQLLRELARYFWTESNYTDGMHYYEKILEVDPYQEYMYIEYIERLLQAKLISTAKKVSKRSKKYIEQELGIPIQEKIAGVFTRFSV